MKIKKAIEIAQQVIELAEEKDWSEEELVKAIRLLHSEFEELRRSIEFT